MAHYAMTAGMAAMGISSIGEATMLQGALLGTASGAIGGFGSGLAAGYAGGEGSFGDMLAAGGWGALGGYAQGGVMGGVSSSQFWNGLSGNGWMTDGQIQAQRNRIANMMAVLDEGKYSTDHLLQITYKAREISTYAATASAEHVIELERIVIQGSSSAANMFKVGMDVASLGLGAYSFATGNVSAGATAVSATVHNTLIFGSNPLTTALNIGSVVFAVGAAIALPLNPPLSVMLGALSVSCSAHAGAIDYLPNPFDKPKIEQRNYPDINYIGALE